jgi:nitroreductase
MAAGPAASVPWRRWPATAVRLDPGVRVSARTSLPEALARQDGETPPGEPLDMELDEAIRGRRSIRQYSGQPVDDDVVQAILDLARQAPSSMNGQPWTFTVVRDPETKRRLAEIKNRYCPVEKREFRADFLAGAPAIVVVSVDRRTSHDRAIENGVLAAAHLLLAAHGRGLGSVYMSAYRQDEPAVSDSIRQLLGMPDDVMPISILPLGYPAETPEPKPMQPLRDVVFHERYGRR